MSLPAENSRRRELVPLEMQEKINFIRKKKAEAACASGQASDVAVTSSVMGENPTNTTDSTKAVSNSILDEDTKRKLAFIKEQKKKGISNNDLDKPNDDLKHDPNDPLDPETRRKLDFVRKNKKNSAPAAVLLWPWKQQMIWWWNIYYFARFEYFHAYLSRYPCCW